MVIFCAVTYVCVFMKARQNMVSADGMDPDGIHLVSFQPPRFIYDILRYTDLSHIMQKTGNIYHSQVFL